MGDDTDEYGFYRSEVEAIQVDQEKETEREEKWKKMFAHWDKKVANEKVKERARKGIPRALRAEAWMLLTGAAREMQRPENKGVYAELRTSDKVPHETCEVLQRDLHRTLPNHELFRDSSTGGQDKLRLILHAYAAKDPEVGYVQGMGYVASMMLVAGMTEEQAFWALCQLMSDKVDPQTKTPNKFHMRRLYLPGFPELRKMQYVLNGLIKKVLPKLWAHFEREGIDPSIQATQWFLTLFIYQFPRHPYLLFRILDCFMSEGWKVMYRVALCLLELEASTLLKMKMEGMFMHLKNLQSSHDPQKILQAMFRLDVSKFTPLSIEHINALSREYEAKKSAGEVR